MTMRRPGAAWSRLLSAAALVLLAACGGGGDDEPQNFSVTAQLTGNGAGSVAVAGTPLACTLAAGVQGGTCAATVQEGTQVTLTATASAGSSFGGWSGACAAAGTNTTCTVTVSANAAIGASFTLTPVTITTAATLPQGRVGQPYNAQLVATGGNGTYAWAVVGGILQTPLTLNAAGQIAGVPLTVETFSFTARVTSGGVTAEREFTIQVLPPSVAITSAAPPAGEQGVAYSHTFTASGGDGIYAWSVAAGTLPAGLTLSGGGVLAGTPTAAGSTQFTVQVASAGSTATQAVTLQVEGPPITITTTTLANARQGQAYNATLTATGGLGTYTWAVSGGALPAGLTLNAGGTISGTPTASGAFNVTVRATSGARTAEQALSLTVLPPVVTITTTSLPAATPNVAYSQQLAATGGVGNYQWTVSAGALPGGFTLSAAGVLAGTAAAEGTFNFTVQATSGAESDTQDLTLTVAGATITLTAGGGQTAFVGNYVPLVPTFTARNAQSQLVAGATVTFEVLSGGGTLTRTTAQTDLTGRASPGAWRLGPSAGAQTIRATLGSSQATATATAIIVPATQFNIEVRYLGTPPSASVQQAFETAAQRWESVLIGDLSNLAVNASISCESDGTNSFVVNETIDDVVIFARVGPIDGPGDVLGSAGPRLIRNSGSLAAIGCMTFDEVDLSTIAGNGTLGAVILHEMGHVLGFNGFNFAQAGRIVGTDGPDPYFTGDAARSVFQAVLAIGGNTYSGTPVPLETNQFGAGTRNSHWRESLFDFELMTGFVDAAFTGNPLSALTLAAMRDLGYVVNDALADPYGVPNSALRAGPASRGMQLNEAPPSWPIDVVDDGGRLIRRLRSSLR